MAFRFQHIVEQTFRCVLSALCILTAFHVNSQPDFSICQTTHQVLKNISKYHYNPPSFDTETRRQVLNLFFEQIDPQGFYFLSSDKKTLEDILGMDGDDVFCKAIEKAAAIYRQRASQTDSFVMAYLHAPLTFNNTDSISYKPGQMHKLAEDASAQKQLIGRKLKFDVLLSMCELKEDSSVKLTDAQVEEKARKQAEKKFADKNLQGNLEKNIAEGFWNAIALRCDPHSSYFNDSEKSGFDKSLSSQELSYGLEIRENENAEIEIVHLIPGSAAWKANELNEGDIITALTAEGRRINISSMTEQEITELIESARYKKLLFTVKKKNHQEKKVTLIPETIQSETNVINSYILKDNDIRMGYIPLPAFYVDVEGESYLGCANDVAKEILKLKKENINGLILDLRFNGGGALQEAMGLAGIFIDEGPLAIEKFREGKPLVLRDFNRGTIYDEPLIVLVNGFSASASEFLAAVLQDYKRAVIVGGNTYGKGTAQQVILNDSLEKNSLSKKSGYLKLTRSKFYRVNSSSVQTTGVEPDIVLPELDFSNLFVKEKKEQYHLAPDTVAKKLTIHTSPDLPIAYLAENSRKRINSGKYFQRLKSVSDSITAFYGTELKIALIKKSVAAYLLKIDALDSLADNVSAHMTSSFTFANNQYDDKILAIDKDLRLMNEEKIKELSSDMELEEACFIMKDMINNSHTQLK